MRARSRSPLIAIPVFRDMTRAVTYIVLLIAGFPAPGLAKTSDDVLDPAIIVNLKKGHMLTCLPTVREQLLQVGASHTDESLNLYCGCLGVLYFNDFTNGDYQTMIQTKRLPSRIANIRKDIQHYCADKHID